MPTLHREFTVDADLDTTWARLADLQGINTLLTFLGEVTCDGNTRSCVLTGLGRLDELILSVDSDRRRVAYAIQSSPLRMQHHSASMAVDTTAHGTTRFTWITDFAPAEVTPHVESLVDQGVTSITAALAR